MQTSVYIVVVLVVGCLGAMIGFLLWKRFSEAKIGSAEEASKRIVEEAKKKAEIIEKEGRFLLKRAFKRYL